MTYDELRAAVLHLVYAAFSDSSIDVGPTYDGLRALASELRGADASAVVETESGPVDLAPMRLESKDTLASFFAAIPEGVEITIRQANY